MQGEFRYVDEAGQFQDRDIYEAILADDDEQGAENVSRRFLRSQGWSEEHVKILGNA